MAHSDLLSQFVNAMNTVLIVWDFSFLQTGKVTQTSNIHSKPTADEIGQQLSFVVEHLYKL